MMTCVKTSPAAGGKFMPQDLDPKIKKELAFTIEYALRLGRGKVRDMQKDLDDKKLAVVIDALIEQLLLSNWRIERGPPTPSHSAPASPSYKKEP
jgi:hypothetical protein